MSVPESSGSGATPGLFASLRSFWGVVVAILHTRLDLLTSEVEDEAARAVKLVVAGLVSLLCLFTGFFFAMFFMIAIAWPTPYRLCVIGSICLVYLIVGTILLLIARRMIIDRPRFLSQTLTELRKDAEGLRNAVAPKKEEGKP
jgi:uncharacterized membrane protein YqjE